MKKNNKKGFTLVELVIVVAVMAVLVAVAIPTVKSITGTAKDSVRDTNARTIESVIKLAEAEASKAADGTAELDSQAIFDAIYDAKLGIDEGVYVYTAETGVVKYDTTTAGADGVFKITFTDGVAAAGAAAPALLTVKDDGTAITAHS